MVRLSTIAFLGCLLFSCGKSEEKRPNGSDQQKLNTFESQFTYQVFQSGRGYGFEIFKDRRLYIFQPIIPCIRGFHAFTSYTQAKSVAELLVHKLERRKFSFLVQKFEIDSLLKHFPEIRKKIAGNDWTLPLRPALDQGGRKDSSLLIPFSLPHLKNEPLKLKWIAKEHVPFGYRAGSFSFAIGKFVFIGSGEYRDAIIRDFWCYDTQREVWTCLAEVPVRCFSGAAFSIQNKGYAGLGTEIGTSSGKFERHMFRYDPVTNTWKRIKDFPGTGRIDPSVFVIADKAYVGTGYDGSPTHDFYFYEPGKEQWKRIADFPGGNIHAAIGIGTGKQGYIVAGARAPIDFKFAYEYLTATNTWVRKQDMPGLGRNFLSGCFIDSGYFIAGCGGSYESNLRLRDFYIYDINKDEWNKAPNYPIGIVGNSRQCGANVGGRIFMGTGFNVDYENDWNEFEFYYEIRTVVGDYSESASYPITYDGQWQLFQECNIDNCFVGMEIKSAQQLGTLTYCSRVVERGGVVTLGKRLEKKLVLFPRSFIIKTVNQPQTPIYLRLFFTKDELAGGLRAYNEQVGATKTLDDLQVVQRDADTPVPVGTSCFIKPHWFSYGYKGQEIVAEFPVSSLHSEFYLSLKKTITK